MAAAAELLQCRVGGGGVCGALTARAMAATRDYAVVAASQGAILSRRIPAIRRRTVVVPATASVGTTHMVRCLQISLTSSLELVAFASFYKGLEHFG